MASCLAKVVSQFEQIGHDSLYSESCNCIGDKKEGKPKNSIFSNLPKSQRYSQLNRGQNTEILVYGTLENFLTGTKIQHTSR